MKQILDRQPENLLSRTTIQGQEEPTAFDPLIQTPRNVLTPLDPHTVLMQGFTAGNRDIRNLPETLGQLTRRRNAIAPGDSSYDAVVAVTESTLTPSYLESKASLDALPTHQLSSISEDEFTATNSILPQSHMPGESTIYGRLCNILSSSGNSVIYFYGAYDVLICSQWLSYIVVFCQM